MSEPEERLLLLLAADGLPAPVREWRFVSPRRWRWDMAWPDQLLAVEVQGGMYLGGRHNRPRGYEGDCEKANAATLLGWRVLRFTPAMIEDGRAVATITEALG